MTDKVERMLKRLESCREMLLEVSCDMGIAHDSITETPYQAGLKYVHGKVIEAEEFLRDFMKSVKEAEK